MENPKARILKYAELRSVATVDSGDKLVNMQTQSTGLSSIELFCPQFPCVREQVWNRLIKAATALTAIDEGYRLRVWYAYRPVSIQKQWFDEQCARLQRDYPLLSQQELIEQAHKFVASPDVAGHPTGGAVDLTISKDGKELDMGCAYLDFDSDRLPTFCDGLTPRQTDNRMMLREVMMENEFAPFNGEWWHFSYGDKEWAAFWGKPHALFDVVEFPSLSG